jgi:hypothetical protein
MNDVIGRLGILSAAAWLAAGALPAAAQAPAVQAEAEAEATDSGPPLAGLDEEQIIAFFMLISANAEIEELVAPMIETMFEPGEAVPDWRESGVDILGQLAARPGGAVGNLLRDDDTEVLSVNDLSGTGRTPDLPGFTRLRLRAAPPGGANEVVWASFSPGVWMAVEMQYHQRGNALCYKGLNGVTLHSKTALTTWDIETTYLTAVMIATFDRVAAREICTVYEAEGDAYRARSFLPDGRRLPQIDTQSTLMRIMPAAQLSTFMQTATPSLPAE